MNTDFFSNLTRLNTKGEYTIFIKQTSENTMVVSVLFKDTCGDDAHRIIPPLTFRNKTADELNNGFFTNLVTAVPKAAEAFSSMEHYLKQVEESKKQSAMGKDKDKKVEKKLTDKERKYEDGLKAAEQLEKEGKYREAWMKIPDPGDYPEQAELLRERRTALSKHFAPDLFNAGQEAVA